MSIPYKKHKKKNVYFDDFFLLHSFRYQNRDLSKNKNRVVLLLLFWLAFFNESCKKFIEVDPPITSINSENVYENDATAVSVLTGLYIKLSQYSMRSFKLGSISFFTGLYGDELLPDSSVDNDVYHQFYHNNIMSSSNEVGIFWTNCYNFIYTLNSAIEGLSQSTGLTPAVKEQLLGEAKFLRSLCYFYLVNLYGDVPLILTSDYSVNASLERTSTDKIYQQIIADLKEAKYHLREDYLGSTLLTTTTERVRPNKYTATALLARVYLFTNDFANADKEATEVISQSTLYQLTPLDQVFLANSNEAIWQLQPVNGGWNTEDGRTYILPSTGPSATWPVYLTNYQVNGFENNDLRKEQWLGHMEYNGKTIYYSYKYKVGEQYQPVSEYKMVLRLGEQYLIRAEARAQQDNLEGANNDLRSIRSRAGLPETSVSSKSELLTAILHERQVELFTEWGNRWLDLKRTNEADALMESITPEKGGIWNSTKNLFPIPTSEISRNPKLTQNPGYN